MTLKTGQTLSQYRLVEQIGAGGMGVVWKARDTTLDRDVAIKVLPEAFAREVERLARFEREAKLLASLNHPNIASVYGLHEEGGQRFIAMEMISGEDLAVRLAREPLPLDEALPVARRIAQALEAAHASGVFHRDLKPANIKLADDGSVKVLDFGLAKAFEPHSASGPMSASLSPTLTTGGTQAGLILGTAPYMSPEQARGKATDRRTDIWAFGCLLYEMLTGQHAYRGETVTDILANVVKAEPDWNALPADTPPALRILMQRCLRKDAARRLQDAGDLRVEIEDILSGETVTASGELAAAPPVPRSMLLPALGWLAAATLAVTLAIVWFAGGGSTPPAMIEFNINLPGMSRTREIAVSPDGRSVAVIAQTPTGSTELWLRTLENVTARVLPGTEGASFPFWSPDSRSIGLFVQDKLKRIDISTGTTQTIADAPNGRGGTWNKDGDIVFAPEGRDVLYRVAATGGVPVPVTTLDAGVEQTSHRVPHFLPDGRRFTYFALRGDTPEGRVYVGSLESHEQTFLFSGFSEAYVAGGRIFYIKEGTLVSQEFDTGNLTLAAEVLPIAPNIFTSVPSWGRAAFSISGTGTLAYRRGLLSGNDELVWFSRSGQRLETVGEPGQYLTAELSPDEQRIAFLRARPALPHTNDILLLDLARNTLLQVGELSGPGVPAWSPDGDSLLYTSERAILRQPLGGTATQEVILPPQPTSDTSVPTVPAGVVSSPDGTFLIVDAWDSVLDWDLWLLPLTGDAAPSRLVTAPGRQRLCRVSPDSRWLSYESEESGQPEVYLQRYPEGGRWILSTGGGTTPRWRADGRELFYLAADATLMSVKLDLGDEVEIGTPEPLFRTPILLNPGFDTFSVTANGERFLVNVPVDPLSASTVTVIVNSNGIQSPRGGR